METERQRPDLGLQEVLAESLAVRSDQGQSALGMRGIIAAVRALEDLCWGDGILVAALPSPLLVLWRRRWGESPDNRYIHDAIVTSCVFSRRAQTTALPEQQEVRFSSNFGSLVLLLPPGGEGVAHAGPCPSVFPTVMQPPPPDHVSSLPFCPCSHGAIRTAVMTPGKCHAIPLTSLLPVVPPAEHVHSWTQCLPRKQATPYST